MCIFEMLQISNELLLHRKRRKGLIKHESDCPRGGNRNLGPLGGFKRGEIRARAVAQKHFRPGHYLLFPNFNGAFRAVEDSTEFESRDTCYESQTQLVVQQPVNRNPVAFLTSYDLRRTRRRLCADPSCLYHVSSAPRRHVLTEAHCRTEPGPNIHHRIKASWRGFSSIQNKYTQISLRRQSSSCAGLSDAALSPSATPSCSGSISAGGLTLPAVAAPASARTFASAVAIREWILPSSASLLVSSAISVSYSSHSGI